MSPIILMVLEPATASFAYCCSVLWPGNQARKKYKETHIFDQINLNPHQQPIL